MLHWNIYLIFKFSLAAWKQPSTHN